MTALLSYARLDASTHIVADVVMVALVLAATGGRPVRAVEPPVHSARATPQAQVATDSPREESARIALSSDGAQDAGLLAAGGGTGACCSDTGSCAETDAAACTAAGGQFLGVGTRCSGDACQGACCTTEGCVNWVPAFCTEVFQGFGTSCADLNIDCPPTEGACCCFGSCSFATPGECPAPNCTFLGLSLECHQVSCDPPEVLGACCFADGCNSGFTQAACEAAGGAHQGPGSSCNSDPCSGACCFEASCADHFSRFRCGVDGGQFQGMGTGCLDESIACRAGACCAHGFCGENSSPEECGGSFFLGMTCDDADCVFGACCTEFDCNMRTQNDCVSAGGEFLGPNSSCGGGSGGDEEPEPDAEGSACTGACCESGGCLETLLGACSGLFGGVGSTCADTQCPFGACCFGFGDDCGLFIEDECAKFGGQFLGVDTSCDGCLGACCQHGVCDNTSPEFCDGTFLGRGSDCANIECPVGACCFDGFCETRTAGDCLANGGDFRGKGTTCKDVACAGACCAFGADACLNNVGPETCALLLDGVYQGDGTACSDNTIACPSRAGACCTRSGFGGGGGGDDGAPVPFTEEGLQCAMSILMQHVSTGGGLNCHDGLTPFECALVQGDFVESATCQTAGCPTTLCPGLGDCCVPHRSNGCSDETCCRTVCAMDPFCCLAFGGGWDDVCIELANRLCGDPNDGFCAARRADINGDGRVDLLDFGAYQLVCCDPPNDGP